MRYFTFGIALSLLTSVVGAADAKTLYVHCTGSGTYADGVETHIDTNGDGMSAILNQGIENCGLGKFFFQEEVEWVPQPTVTTCPAGMTNEWHIDPAGGQNRRVAIDENTGDQLFGKYTSATLCLNLSAFPFPWTISGQSEFIGGTGKYTDAIGTKAIHFAGRWLIYGSKDGAGGGFGQFPSLLTVR
jgi:hypothetical protein